MHSTFRQNLVHRLLICIFVFCALSPSALAYNSNSNRQIIPLGETEAFMANTGTGRADDTGAVYYNPAGLADLGSGRVSVTGSVYLSFSTRTDGAFLLDGSTLGYQASGFNTVPAFYVAAYRLGEWVGAVSVLVPNSLQVENRTPFATTNTQGNITQTTRTSDLWFGLSAARKIDERWSLGATLFGVQHSESSSIGLDVNFPATPTSSLVTSIQQVTLNVFGLSTTFGALYKVDERWRLGFRAQTSLVQLFGNADTFQSIHTVKGGVITTTGEDHIGTKAYYRMPFDFTLGTSVIPADWIALLADVSLQLGATYSSIPGSALSEQVSLSPAPRVSFGAELRPEQWLQLRTGVYYIPSANGAEAAGTPGYLRENYYGLTAGLGISSSRVQSGIGGFYIWSNGQTTPSGASAGTVSPVSSKGVGGLLTTSYLL